MTSAEIRQSFLDFFREKQHTIVPSSSLLPDAPNLLFTNAGMNQFVPIFLGQMKPQWNPARTADTQKCIRAGGKHNDLEDVGLDTYHHTFFEMLGNWSFGDYFKKEAIDWAWELLVERWHFPKERLYATYFGGDDKAPADLESRDLWKRYLTDDHIVPGNRKDNFWMMADTGPRGPNSEVSLDLTPNGDGGAKLVNSGSPQSIEIWNLVFIQFNANPDGSLTPLPAKHVDTGMGFERVTSMIQCTNGFKDFTKRISNYETDVFSPIFRELEKLSGKKYTSTLPSDNAGEQGKVDIAFRVIADHIRCLSFAIADGIQPSNEGRGYVLRRILRRAVRYGRTLGFHEPFLYKLVDVLKETMSGVFPEIRNWERSIENTIRTEEEAFNKTLDKGITIFENEVFSNAIADAASKEGFECYVTRGKVGIYREGDELLVGEFEFKRNGKSVAKFSLDELHAGSWRQIMKTTPVILRWDAFKLYDTYGFPLDLTELMARERGLTVDKEGFEKLMEEQRARARAAQKKEVISLSQIETTAPTKFVGFETLESPARVLEVVSVKDKTAVVLDMSPFYAEMGGQVGDTGELTGSGQLWRVTNTQKSGNTWLHFIDDGSARVPRAVSGVAPETSSAQTSSEENLDLTQARRDASPARETRALPIPGDTIQVEVDIARRNAIQRHHTVTHLLHWALHEVASKEASQKGSFVGPDKLTFDFNSAPLTPQQVADIEKLVNERILENAGVSWTEVAHADVKNRKDVMQFFGDKYGDTVRVVQIGGGAGKLDGYSMELCGGTHARATGEIGLFRIIGESAIAAGVRRIEAVAGLTAYDLANQQLQLIKSIAGTINSPVHELEKKIDSLLSHQKELEKSLRTATLREI